MWSTVSSQWTIGITIPIKIDTHGLIKPSSYCEDTVAHILLKLLEFNLLYNLNTSEGTFRTPNFPKIF